MTPGDPREGLCKRRATVQGRAFPHCEGEARHFLEASQDCSRGQRRAVSGPGTALHLSYMLGLLRRLLKPEIRLQRKRVTT